MIGLKIPEIYWDDENAVHLLADNGVPDHILARWAGHATVKTTKKWYVRPDGEDLREAATTWDGPHGEVNGRA